jgi:L-amino acid N-acyltransferase YncA
VSVSLAMNAMKSAETVRIRMATPADRDDILAMYESFEPRPASLGLPPRVHLDEWLDRLAPSSNFLAFAGEKLVGHAILCADSDSAEVAIFVHQNFRNRGIGRRLLETLVDQARQTGLHSVWGMTELDNVPMLRLARALGFTQERDPSVFRMDL